MSEEHRDASGLELEQLLFRASGLELKQVLFAANAIADEAIAEDARTIGELTTLLAIACSPTENLIAAGSANGKVHLARVDGTAGKVLLGPPCSALSFSPDGKLLAVACRDGTIWIWQVHAGEDEREQLDHSASVTTVAWMSDDSTLVSGGNDGVVRVWLGGSSWSQTDSFECQHAINCVACSPTDALVAIASYDNSVILWNARSRELRRLSSHDRAVTSVAFSPDGRSLASGSLDASVVIWDVESGQPQYVLERHTTEVVSVAYSPDGHWLASKSRGGRVLLMRCGDFAQMGRAREDSVTSIASIAFCGNDRLATFGAVQRSVRLWRLPDPALSAPPLTRYCNAKVVLLGDSGVGKSGLALALTGQPFAPTESTHGRRVWQMPLCVDEPQDERRELLLWDLAGQPAYRLVHQLHLHDANVALIVFDSKSETDPFSGVRYWERALRQAERVAGRSGPRIRRIAVAARIDRGGVNVDRDELTRLKSELSLDDLIMTSAKLGTGIAQLRDAVAEAIDWSALPKLMSSDMLQRTRDLHTSLRAQGARLITLSAFLEASPERKLSSDMQDEVRACIARLESRGIVRCLTFGDCVLLEPELLDSYATAIIEAAREEPDGLGCISEDDVRAGRFRLGSEHRLSEPSQEALLLIATIELLLRSEIALREHTEQGTMLVFPAQSTRAEPTEYSHVPAALRVAFQGAAHSIYTALAVRLCRSGTFRKRRLWKDGLLLEDLSGAASGVRLRQPDEATGVIEIFHLADASDLARVQLAEFVHGHIQRRAVLDSVVLQRGLVCRSCRETVPERQVELRRAKGFHTLNCPICDTVNDLSVDSSARPSTREQVMEMDRNADRARDGDSARTTVHGKLHLSEYDVFLCHNVKDKPEVRVIADRLEMLGILPWLDERAVPAGTDWINALQTQIRKIGCACVFVGGSGVGPWQDVELNALLNEFAERRCRLIPVILANAAKQPKLPAFLNSFSWVDFRLDTPDPISRLVEAIQHGGVRDARNPRTGLAITDPSEANLLDKPIS